MTLKEHVEAVLATMPEPLTFIYGSTNTLNAEVDSTTVYPVVFLLDIDQVELELLASGAIGDKYAEYFEFFKPIEMDETSSNADTIQAEMLSTIKKFIVRLREYRVDGTKIFDFKAGMKAKSLKFVDKYDRNVAGRTLDITLIPMYQDSFC